MSHGDDECPGVGGRSYRHDADDDDQDNHDLEYPADRTWLSPSHMDRKTNQCEAIPRADPKAHHDDGHDHIATFLRRFRPLAPVLLLLWLGVVASTRDVFHSNLSARQWWRQSSPPRPSLTTIATSSSSSSSAASFRTALFGFDIDTELHPTMLSQAPPPPLPYRGHGDDEYHHDVRRTGGVLVFYHLAKTGGTTLRTNVARYGAADPYLAIEMRLLSNMTAYAQAVVDAESLLMKTTRRTRPQVLILEFHGILPSLLTLAPTLTRWRQLAVTHGTAFYAFSLVREPISYAVSYFNFYLAQPCSFPRVSGKCTHLLPATEANLRATRRYNHQCQLYARDHWTLFGDDAGASDGDHDPHVTPAECAAVYHALQDTMDWVGVTAQLATHTWPRITQWLWHRMPSGDHDDQPVLPLHSVNQAWKPQRLSPTNLTPAVRQTLLESNWLDWELYQNVSRDYAMAPPRPSDPNDP